MGFETAQARRGARHEQVRRFAPSRAGFAGLAPWQAHRVMALMDADIAGDLSLRRLAGACGLSVSHFARAFRQTTGVSPHSWILQRRVDRALDLLAGQPARLSEIALACGFADQSHFTRVFVQRVGKSPGAWRRERAGEA